MAMRAEIGLMCLQAETGQRWPAKQRVLGKKPGTDFPLQPSGGTSPADTIVLDIQLQGL